MVRATSRKAHTVVIDLGQVRVGRTLTHALPSSITKRVGVYDVRLSVVDPAGQTLQRTAKAAGRTVLRVRAKAVVKPSPVTTPDPIVKPTPTPAGQTPTGTSSSSTRFPVAGAHTFGGPDARFGAGRVGHTHQGQDVPGAQGTPIVAPMAGTVTATDYQAAAAGEYVVMHGADGHDFFFAHCVRHSTVVAEGDAVRPGSRLCDLGQTGDAEGPHLHFEVWVDGWRSSKSSHPVDPLPFLKAWEAADPKW